MKKNVKTGAAAVILAFGSSLPALTQTWSGPYVGAQAGAGIASYSVFSGNGGFDNSQFIFPPNGPPIVLTIPTTVKLDATNAVGGVYAGYAWQLGSVVLGAEVDVSFGSISKTGLGIGPDGDDMAAIKVGTRGIVTGRAGIALGNWLPYLKAGAGLAHVNAKAADYGTSSGTIDQSDLTQVSDTKSAWVFGGGLEYRFASNWSARLDYQRLVFENFTSSNEDAAQIGPLTGVFESFRHNLDVDIVTVGMTYRLN